MKGNLWIYQSRHTFRMGTKWTFPGISNFAKNIVAHSSHPIPLHPTQSHHWCFNVETYCIYFWYRNNDEPKKLPGVDGRGLGWQRWDPSHSNPTPIPPGPIVQNCRHWFLWWSSHWAVEKFRWIFCTRKCELFRVNAVVSRSAIKSVSTHKMQNNIVRCKNYCMMQHNITRRKTIWRHAKEYYEMQNNITRCKTTLLNAKENIWDAKQYCKPWFFQTKL